MDSSPIQAVVRHLRRIATPKAGAPSTDAELLARFVAQRDEAAFAEIVQRHGPLVWALCRSQLSAADADDAFQATFLVLARQARKIRKPGSLVCWLSGVARRVVRRARSQETRRREAERRVEAPRGRDEAGAVERNEWRMVLNEELNRLPEKYRLPLLLCYYQGLTNEEAARRLGWPHGTVCGRLARARDLLRGRLARRGVALTVGALAVGTTGPPSELLAATMRVCGSLSGVGAIGVKLTSPVLQLAEGVMYAMWFGRVKTLAIGVLAVVVLGGGAAGWALIPAKAQGERPGQVTQPAVAAPQPVRTPPEKPTPPPGNPIGPGDIERVLAETVRPPSFAAVAATDDELRRLRKERYHAALRELDRRTDRFGAGARGETIEVMLGCVDRLVESEVALSPRVEDRVAAYERVVKFTDMLDKATYQKGLS
jgi:RNA polymerase sigma factor (sigma-70 family)